MSIRKRCVRVIAAAVAAGALLGTAAATASAWPLPLTSDDVNFLNQARGNFPGDDDTLLIVGNQMCRGLYTGQSVPSRDRLCRKHLRCQPGSSRHRVARGTRDAVHLGARLGHLHEGRWPSCPAVPPGIGRGLNLAVEAFDDPAIRRWHELLGRCPSGPFGRSAGMTCTCTRA